MDNSGALLGELGADHHGTPLLGDEEWGNALDRPHVAPLADRRPKRSGEDLEVIDQHIRRVAQHDFRCPRTGLAKPGGMGSQAALIGRSVRARGPRSGNVCIQQRAVHGDAGASRRRPLAACEQGQQGESDSRAHGVSLSLKQALHLRPGAGAAGLYTLGMGREQSVEVRFSQAELEQLKRAASAVSLDLTAFLRHAVLAVASEIRDQPYTNQELGSIHREASSRGHIWELSELQERGLPLYWNEGWVRARLAEGKSIKQLAILCGAPVTTVGNHLQNVYGLRTFRTLTEKDIITIRERYAAGDSRRQIARDLGVSSVTVGKYLKGLPTEFERKEVRTVQEHEIDQALLPPNVQGLMKWSDRLFNERVQQVGTWPTSTAVIAEKAFGGDRDTTKDWTGRMVKKGRLVRLSAGWFDLVR